MGLHVHDILGAGVHDHRNGVICQHARAATHAMRPNEGLATILINQIKVGAKKLSSGHINHGEQLVTRLPVLLHVRRRGTPKQDLGPAHVALAMGCPEQVFGLHAVFTQELRD